MQNHVLVVDKNKDPLMPCHPARARKLLKKGRAAVLRRYPFTIIILDREGGETQETQVKVDPGAKTTGIAIVRNGKNGRRVVWAAELTHRGFAIKDALEKRRAIRRTRRNRKTRYRKPRFDNRGNKGKGWLPPSLMSRVHNIETWVLRLSRLAPVSALSMELVRFDTQLMQNPKVSGVEYQQGTLAGYEVREYLLEKYGRKCCYCGCKDVPLQIEHIISKANGGSNRIDNLCIACEKCNQKKGRMNADEFGYPHIQAQARRSMRDTAAVNATRWRLYETLQAIGLPVEVGTGGRTKYNRSLIDAPKAHWIDAACVGKSGEYIYLDPTLQPLLIKAVGRQSRQMCRMNKYGFPRTKPKQNRMVKGFQSGDIVRAVVPKGKLKGTHVGAIGVRRTGSFALYGVGSVNWKHCQAVHRADGYSYRFGVA